MRNSLGSNPSNHTTMRACLVGWRPNSAVRHVRVLGVGQDATYDPLVTGNAPLPPVPRPSPAVAQKYLEKWHAGINKKTDVALRTLFQKVTPNNSDVGEVAVKVAALNGIYATNIYAVVQVAEHIVRLGIDTRLAEAEVDSNLIEDIARVEIPKGKQRRNYAFATKYCAFHKPDLYPIYDSLVDGVLNDLLRQGEAFDSFVRGEHWRTDYTIWCRSITKFRIHYGLEAFSIRDIDKYLWMVAKERQAKSGTAGGRRPRRRSRIPSL